MNTIKLLSLFLLIFASIMLTGLFGCSKKATNPAIVTVCDTLPCHNGANCNQGVCQCVGNFTGVHCDSCILGYEGAGCATLTSAKFVGNYAGSDTCSGSVSPDSWTISAGATLTQLQISVAGITLIANFSGNTFTIPNQSASGLTFNSGTGTVSGNHLTVTYNYTNSNSTQTCKFGGSK